MRSSQLNTAAFFLSYERVCIGLTNAKKQPRKSSSIADSAAEVEFKRPAGDVSQRVDPGGSFSLYRMVDRRLFFQQQFWFGSL